MRSHVDPDATEGCHTGSPQVASTSVYGIISGASYERRGEPSPIRIQIGAKTKSDSKTSPKAIQNQRLISQAEQRMRPQFGVDLGRLKDIRGPSNMSKSLILQFCHFVWMWILSLHPYIKQATSMNTEKILGFQGKYISLFKKKSKYKKILTPLFNLPGPPPPLPFWQVFATGNPVKSRFWKAQNLGKACQVYQSRYP